MGRRLNREVLFIAYCQGVDIGNSTPIITRDPVTGESTTFYAPRIKKASYRDLARRFGCTVRAIEKIGSQYHFYRRRKSMYYRSNIRVPDWDLCQNHLTSDQLLRK